MKKIIIAILCLIMVITAVVLSVKPAQPAEPGQTTLSEEQTSLSQDEAVQEVGTIRLPYFNGKPFNPFLTDSPTNLAVSTLLYDSLFVMNEDWSSSPLIAKEFHNDGKTLSVKLVDGQSLTAYDVVYSFKLAQKCDAYKGRLSNFTKAEAGTDTVTFTLRQSDVYAQQCLTFPIVQNGTGGATLPIGSGRYILRSNNGQYVLSANTKNTRNEALLTKTISLTPIYGEDDEIYRVQTGALSYYYNDMRTGTYTKLTASTVPVQTNNLIYLGYNGNNENLKNKTVIEALSLAFDKNALADTVFDNFCSLTETPFNPAWFSLKSLQLPVSEYNLIKAGNLLDEEGYKYSENDKSYRYDSDGYFSLKIIVNKESPTKINCAKFIGKALINLGINVRLLNTTNMLKLSETEAMTFISAK